MRKMVFATIMLGLVVWVPITEVQADVLKTLIITFIGANGIEHVAGVFKK